MKTRMFNPPHPGELLQDTVLAESRISVTEFAKKLGVSRVALSRVVNSRAAVSADLALRLAAALGGSAVEAAESAPATPVPAAVIAAPMPRAIAHVLIRPVLRCGIMCAPLAPNHDSPAAGKLPLPVGPGINRMEGSRRTCIGAFRP